VHRLFQYQTIVKGLFMSRQPMSFLGHLHAACQRGVRVAATPITFVGRAAGQALERIVPHGASEIGQALYGGGSAYAPPGVTERLTQEQGNVHGTAPAQVAQQTQAAVQAPQVTAPRIEPAQAESLETYQRMAATRARIQAPEQGRSR
jgi:hypothetical protein